jgi:hypothetical protein
MVTRVRDFGVVEAASFPATTLGGELFAQVGAAATELAAHVARRISGSSDARQGTASKAVAREALRAALEMIRRTVRAMSVTMPGLDAKFRIPRNMTDQELLSTAQAFALDAAPLKADLIRYALPADFLADLDGHIEAFASAISIQHTGRGRQVSATAGIDDALARALSAVRQLDAIVRNTFHDDPQKLAAWESARHVQRSARTKQSKQTPPNAAPPSQT